MRVLIVNTSSHQGGAAIAANRLMNALCKQGVDAQMLTRRRKFPAFYWERFVIWVHNRFSRKNLFAVSIANTGTDITQTEAYRKADIIHLHWVNQGFLSLKGLEKIFESGKPIVITMHDMWYCTSICHHAYTCKAYETKCHDCAYLRYPGEKDLSVKTFIHKQTIYKDADICFVAVSNWLAEKAQRSALIRNKRVEVIPNTLSLSQFQMLDNNECRAQLGIHEKNIIIFGAAKLNDPIKGFPLLVEALKSIVNTNKIKKEDIRLIIFGNIKSNKEKFLAEIPVPYTYAGIVNAEELSRLYSASDVVVSSSHYETFGQTLIEAQACGCLSVSWNNSGQSDIICHKQNGFLADYLQTDSLAEGIIWALTEGKDNISREELREDVANRFSDEIVARQTIELYKTLYNK